MTSKAPLDPFGFGPFGNLAMLVNLKRDPDSITLALREVPGYPGVAWMEYHWLND